MGILSFFKNRMNKAEDVHQRALPNVYVNGWTGYNAWNYSQQFYQIPEVKKAIEKYCCIFSLVEKYHERFDREGNITYFENELSRVLNLRANPLQNSIQFFQTAVKRLKIDNNVFIEPTYDERTGMIKSMYVLPEAQFEFRMLNENIATVTFQFPTGQKTYNMQDLIYLNTYADNLLTGGNKNNLTLQTTVYNAIMNQAVSVATPNKVRAILQRGAKNGSGLSGNTKPSDKKSEKAEINAQITTSADNNGLIYLDSGIGITPIDWNDKDINKDMMQICIDTFYSYFGISKSIVNGTATEIENEQFIKYEIEPLCRQMEAEFTSKLFTVREIEFRNKIEFDSERLSMTTTAAATGFNTSMLRNGVLSINEVRERIGYSPIEDGNIHRTSRDLAALSDLSLIQTGTNTATPIQTLTTPVVVDANVVANNTADKEVT